MKIKGLNRGLTHQYGKPLQYYIKLNDDRYALNEAVGLPIKIVFKDKIQCVHCGREVKKTFNSGSCFPCFKSLAINDLCIVKPSLCHFHKGTCRDNQFAQSYCMQPHYVYLAVSSDIKVGLTRATNSLKRWGDQGAMQAVPIAKLPTRKQAGELELLLTEHFPDKTNWRKMLKGEITDKQLTDTRQQAINHIPEEYKEYILTDEQLINIEYPINQLATGKIASYNLDKEAIVDDILLGIKGQYLILGSGVINMKKYAGYHVEISAGSEEIE